MQNVGLDEAQTGIGITGRHINNLTYADDAALMAESEEELKSLLIKSKMRVKKLVYELNFQKTKIMASDPVAAAAKSLKSCPTLCNPIDGSLPDSSIPGILQARMLEWVAISFSNA